MRVVVVAVLTLAAAPVAQAQTESARAVVDSFFATSKAGRWERAAGYLDMEAFTRYFRQLVNMARSELPEPELTAEDLMARDSTMPRAVAEWEVQRRQRYATRRPFHDFSEEFIGITTFRALDALTPTEAAVRWIEAQDPGARWRRYLASRNCAGVPQEALLRANPFDPVVLGAVEVNDSTAYALTTTAEFERSAALDDRMPPSTVLLRRRSGAWRIVANHSIASGSGFMAMSMECAPAKSR